jgi:hypothetical protein
MRKLQRPQGDSSFFLLYFSWTKKTTLTYGIAFAGHMRFRRPSGREISVLTHGCGCHHVRHLSELEKTVKSSGLRSCITKSNTEIALEREKTASHDM